MRIIKWEDIDEKATTAQRRALYRLGFSRSFVKNLSVSEADKAIKAALALHQGLHQHDHKTPTPVADFASDS